MKSWSWKRRARVASAVRICSKPWAEVLSTVLLGAFVRGVLTALSLQLLLRSVARWAQLLPRGRIFRIPLAIPQVRPVLVW